MTRGTLREEIADLLKHANTATLGELDKDASFKRRLQTQVALVFEMLQDESIPLEIETFTDMDDETRRSVLLMWLVTVFAKIQG